MSNRLKRYVIILQGMYVIIFFTFLLSALTVDILFAPPAFAILRVPTNIRGIGEILNAPWTQNIRIYHLALLIGAIMGSINLLGLSSLNSRTWRTILRISSFLGILVLWSGIMFFLLPFLLEGSYSAIYLQSSIIYASVIFVLFLINIATFAVAEKEPLGKKRKNSTSI